MPHPIIMHESIGDLNDRFKNAGIMLLRGLAAPVRYGVRYGIAKAYPTLNNPVKIAAHIFTYFLLPTAMFAGGFAFGFLMGSAIATNAVVESSIQIMAPGRYEKKCWLEHKLYEANYI